LQEALLEPAALRRSLHVGFAARNEHLPATPKAFRSSNPVKVRAASRTRAQRFFKFK
jgi:hypothetical protein